MFKYQRIKKNQEELKNIYLKKKQFEESYVKKGTMVERWNFQNLKAIN